MQKNNQEKISSNKPAGVLSLKSPLLIGGILLGLILIGVILFALPAFLHPLPPTTAPPVVLSPDLNAGAQHVYVRALDNGTYSVSELTVKVGIPVVVHFTADPTAGCGRAFVIYGIKHPVVVSKNGEEALMSFTPEKIGSYEYNCAMRMSEPGKLVVVA